ncbi:MAG: ABC transporter substrate-binding protein [Croceibacterium sp.]
MRSAALLAALLLAGCAGSPPRSRTEHPTIVSLNPCTDAILAEVADPAQVLAISHFSHDPRATSLPLAVARRYPAVGDSAEEVLALDPDLVVASTYLPPATAQAFARLGVRIEAFGVAPTVAESEAQVRRLSALAGHPERGEALVARIEAAMAASRSAAPPVTALVWQEGGLVPGPDSLIAQLLRHTGFASHSAARGLGQGAYLPLEQVLADPPQVIVAAGGERMLTHPALRHLAGAAYARLDPALLYCGGPTIIRASARLAEIRRAAT